MIVNLAILKAELGGIQTKLNFDTVLPFVKAAEMQFRKDVGTELYTYLNNLSATEGDEANLLNLAKSYISWVAYDMAMPHLKFRVGDMGLMKSAPQNTTSITKWEYVDSKEANLAMTDFFLEYFWEALEDIRPTVWTGSDAYKVRNEYFVKSPSELQEHAPWLGKNARLFQKLVTYIEMAEEQLRLEVTDGVVDGLKVKLQAPTETLTPTEKRLLKFIKKYVSLEALERAMPYLPLTIDENGIREVRKKDGLKEEEIAQKQYRNRLLVELRKDCRMTLQKTIEFLDSNATSEVFASYFNKSKNDVTEADDFSDNKSIIL